MRESIAVFSSVIVALNLCAPAQQPSHTTANQQIPEEIKVHGAPKTAREFKCFKDMISKTHDFSADAGTMVDVVRRCGLPDEDVGSGVYVFVYHLKDGSIISVSTPDLKRILVQHSPPATAVGKR
ncbi:MAG TPA: hypothetical protein VJ999_13315 [Candidatus Sulfotelmatobacter sp.]|nr:hypothetical protein [Candidatus Sulfotelmatobacter sp.]